LYFLLRLCGVSAWARLRCSGKTKRLFLVAAPVDYEPAQPTDLAFTPPGKAVRCLELRTQGRDLSTKFRVFGLQGEYI
jgi:hypothetical protein